MSRTKEQILQTAEPMAGQRGRLDLVDIIAAQSAQRRVCNPEDQFLTVGRARKENKVNRLLVSGEGFNGADIRLTAKIATPNHTGESR